MIFIFIFVFVSASLFGQAADSQNTADRNRIIQALGDQPFEERFLLSEQGGFGSSIFVRSPAGSGDPNRLLGTFVLAVPQEAEFAVDTALAILQKLSYGTAPEANSANILIAFLADEKNHRGLRDLLSIADMPENWVLCYLDAEKAPPSLLIRHGGLGYVAPLDIVRPLPFLFKAWNIPFSFGIRYNEIYKLGLVEGPEALSIIWEEEITGFVLSGDERRQTTETVSILDLADFFLDYAGSLSFPVLNPDMHYSFFRLPGRLSGANIFFLSEGQTVALLLFIVSFSLLLFLIYSARYNAILVFHSRLFFKYIWIYFIIFPFLVLSIKISALLYSRIFLFLNAPFGITNYAGAALTLLFAALIFLIPVPLLDHLRFPRKERFYGISAVMFVAIGILSAAFLDFSYVPVFIWAFVFIFLGAFLKKPVLIFLCAFMLPIFPLAALLNIIQTGSPRITEFLLFSGWRTLEDWGVAIQLALLFLPVFMLVKRGINILKKQPRRFYRFKPERKITLAILLAAIFLSMPLQISLLKLQNPAAQRFFVEIHDDEILQLSIADLPFQDSRVITLRAAALGNPIRFDVSLESFGSSSLPPLYSTMVPFTQGSEGRRIDFFLGEFPHNPLVMEIVVPQAFNARLSVTAVYNAWDPAHPMEDPGYEDYVLWVSGSIDIGLQ